MAKFVSFCDNENISCYKSTPFFCPSAFFFKQLHCCKKKISIYNEYVFYFQTKIK